MTASLIYTQGLKNSFLYFPTPIAACVLVGLYGMVIRRAENAKSESQALLKKLQEAYKRLEHYTEQVEELSATEERNRLAGELHDSVTQKIFSITLTAEAARILLEGSRNGCMPCLNAYRNLPVIPWLKYALL